MCCIFMIQYHLERLNKLRGQLCETWILLFLNVSFGQNRCQPLEQTNFIDTISLKVEREMRFEKWTFCDLLHRAACTWVGSKEAQYRFQLENCFFEKRYVTYLGNPPWEICHNGHFNALELRAELFRGY